MNHYDFIYIILHFVTLIDTSNAITSIRALNHTGSYKIVVVENGSANGTAKELNDLYSNSDDIDLVVSKENVGFAKGNNLGVRFAKAHYTFDYIVVMNNDIICSQNCMESRIVDEYRMSSFDLLGPMVLTADGRYDSSPVRKLPIISKEIEKTYKREKKLLLLETMHLFKIYSIISRLRRIKRKNKKEFIGRAEYVVLHGCFIVFSNDYFDKYEDVFDNRTFLYHEEELLGLRVQKKHLKSVFNPDIYVFHREDSASNASIKGNHNRRKNKLKQCIKSSEILLSEM